MESRTPTLTFIDAVRQADRRLPERQVLDEAVAITLSNWKGTRGVDYVMVDSHPVADMFFSRRCRNGEGSDRKQTLDYVQHMFREAGHVCRHADGSSYRLHSDETCGDACTAKYLHAAGKGTRPLTNCCFVEETTAGTCPLCE